MSPSLKATTAMVRAGLAGLLAAVLAACTMSAAQTPSPSPTIDSVSNAVGQLDGIVADVMTRTGVPGLAVAVVHDDKVLLTKGYGIREVGTNAPVGADTVFQIASDSKPISASVVAAAIGKGYATWDDPVVTHLPWFGLSDEWVTEHATIGDLFSMRSGLPGGIGDALEVIGYDREQVLRRLAAAELGPFRSQYAYANFSLTAGAQAVAAAAGKPWEQLAQELVFAPLGMTSTSASEADFRSREDRAALHVRVDGTWEARYQRHPDPQAPAGGVSSSANDLARWMQMMLADGSFEGQQIAPAEALAQAGAPQIRSSAVTTPAAVPYAYRYGMNVHVDAAGQVVLGHSGAFSAGTSSTLRLVPAQHLGISVIANGLIGASEAVADAFLEATRIGAPQTDTLAKWQPVFEHIYAEKPEWSEQAKPASPRPARGDDAYLGRFTNAFYGTVEVKRTAGGLVALLGPKQILMPLEHWAGDLFLGSPEIGDWPQQVPVTFSGRDAAGSATKLNLAMSDPSVDDLHRI